MRGSESQQPILSGESICRPRRAPCPDGVAPVETGPAPDAWRRATYRAHHATEPTQDRPCVRERGKDRPHVDSGPAGPAACSSRDACPSRPSQARPVFHSEPGSPPTQDPETPRQRRRIHTTVNCHTQAVRKRNLHPPRGKRLDIRPRQQLRRFHTLRRRDDHRDEAAHHARQLPILAPPAEDQVRVHIMTPRHNRHRNTRLAALRHDQLLPRLAPATPAKPNLATGARLICCLQHPHSVHLALMDTDNAPISERLPDNPKPIQQAAYAGCLPLQ